MIEALNAIPALFERYGGHNQAAGFTIKNTNLQELETKLSQITAQALIDTDLHPRLDIDAVVNLSSLGLPLYDELQKLEPTGESNPHPVFMTRNLRTKSKRLIGKNKDHLKLSVTDGKSILETIGFNLGHLEKTIPPTFDLAYHLTLNEFRGQTKLQLQIVDIRTAE